MTTEEGEEKANEFKIPFYETSCKEGINVKEVFDTSYYITPNNEMYKFSNDEKVGENVKKAYVYNKNNNGDSVQVYHCYLTNNNEFYLINGTKIADNVAEVLRRRKIFNSR